MSYNLLGTWTGGNLQGLPSQQFEPSTVAHDPSPPLPIDSVPPLSWAPRFCDIIPPLPTPVNEGVSWQIQPWQPVIDQIRSRNFTPVLVDFPGRDVPRPVDTGIHAYNPAISRWGLDVQHVPPVIGAITFDAVNTATATTATSPLVVTVPIISGKAGFVAVAIQATPGTSTVTGITGGGTWSLVAASNASAQVRVEIWTNGVKGGADTGISIAFSGAPTAVIAAFGQYANVASIDTANNTTGNGISPVAMGTSYVKNPHLAIAAFADFAVNATMTQNAGTLRQTLNANANAVSVGLVDNGVNPNPGFIVNINTASADWAGVIVEAIGIVSANTGALWRPTYPDFAPGLPVPTANLGTSFAMWPVPIPNPVTVPPLSWAPTFPDQSARAAPPLVPEGQTALVLTPSTWATGSGRLPWLPSYPDFPGSAAPPLVAEGWFAYVPVPGKWNTVSWLPTYPDFARGQQPLVAEGQFAFVNQAIAPRQSWRPTFPDMVPGLARPVDTGLFAWTYYLPKTGSGLLGFLPTYPDFARGPQRPVDEGAFAFVNLATRPPAPLGSWQPSFPDFAPGVPRPVDVGIVAYVRGIPNPAPLGSWQPTYPDQPGRALPQPVAEGAFRWTYYLPRVGTGLLSFLPNYPDFARGPTPNVPEGWFAYVDSTIPAKAIGWLPTFPDFARAAPRPVDEGTFAYSPTSRLWFKLSWLPTFPDFARAAPRPVDEGAFAYVPALSRWGIDGGKTPWLPVYPERIPGLPRPVDVGYFVLGKKPIAAPLTPLTWHPLYPDLVWARAPLVAEGCFSELVFPVGVIPPGVATCILVPNDATVVLSPNDSTVTLVANDSTTTLQANDSTVILVPNDATVILKGS